MNATFLDDKFPGFKFGLRDTREDARERKDEKRAEREDPKHLAFVRKQRCLIAGKRSAVDNKPHRCITRNEAHHEPPIGKRTGWSDRKAACLCALAHGLRHSLGKTRFERRYGVDIEAECKRLNELNK